MVTGVSPGRSPQGSAHPRPGRAPPDFSSKVLKKQFQVIPLYFLSLFCFSIRSVMQKYLEERGELTFDKIFHQKIGKSCLNKMLFV